MPTDVLHPLTVPSIYGVPLGGIGCGIIGRGYKGEFCRTGLIPGRYNYDVGAADQFILTVKKEGKTVYHQVLSCSSAHVEGLQSWKWSLPAKCGEYIGLYPRSWTVYRFPELKLALICKQISPVIPGNYKDSSLPCGVFQWTALNFDAKNEVEVAITMTWRGPRAPKRLPPPDVGKAGVVCGEIGHLRSNSKDEFTFPFDDADNQLTGCLLETLMDDMPCCFGIASKASQKSALFNELYYISDGGTVWLDPFPEGSSDRGQGNDELTPLDEVRRRNPNVTLHRASDFPIFPGDTGNDGAGDSVDLDVIQNRVRVGKEMGLFGYLEGHEYRMYNTYDVHFTASWALTKLWPLLQQSMNYNLADLTASEDRKPRKPTFKGAYNKNRIVNFPLCVPHDVGNPEDEPFYQVNTFEFYATDEWKDLSPKLILMVWRDWKLTQDDNCLFYMLPIILTIMQTCREKWDKDNDGLIENGGFPDQTYDMWKTVGPSAYVGCLWLASLYATKDMLSYALSKTEDPAKREVFATLAQKYGELLSKAKNSYYTKLWGDVYARIINVERRLVELIKFKFGPSRFRASYDLARTPKNESRHYEGQ
ncbi:hypothetical protein Aperf_G00000026461 [Anoplocephala perfoliata]